MITVSVFDVSDHVVVKLGFLIVVWFIALFIDL